MIQKDQAGGMTGSTLKLIAIITMLVDHVAATLIYRTMNHEMLINGIITIEQKDAYISEHIIMYGTYIIMRAIGRIAFPIFCFLLVEGFLYTRNKGKYAFRLGIFALISEIPFDLAVRNTICSFEGQNVFFTLLLGLLAMMCLEQVQKKYSGKKKRCIFLCILVSVIFMALAFLLKTDYAAGGVLVIIVMYIFREDKMKRMALGVLTLLSCGVMECFAFVNLFFIKKYNGKRGSSLKYVFYCFYPVHLLILALICIALKI
ncbi:MAG: conjugal transfer protein TraX [Lachnospiraceae bacterium]|nr:conjugal transfer protein TraX [Lachnospiraceae bacterium]